MSEFDPVSWHEIEAVSDPPGATVREYVAQLREDVTAETPANAVKHIYDVWKREQDAAERAPEQGAAMLIAYELEREGVIALDDAAMPSLTERRPSSDRLEDLFWNREETMWWIAVRTGVHWALVQYWLYEDDIPLQERNLTDETLAKVRAYRDERA